MSRRTVLVGNAPLTRCMRRIVDSADRVVRFNKARGHRALAGDRTDALWLVNHGGQMAEWLETGALAAKLVMPDVAEVVLPVPLLPGHVPAGAASTGVHPDRINHLDAARRVLEGVGHRVRTLAVCEYRDAQAALHALIDGAREAFPSTGFIAMHHLSARAAPDECIELVGFTFEGWRGHSWHAERRWVETRVDQGRLVVHPVTAPSSRTTSAGTNFQRFAAR